MPVARFQIACLAGITCLAALAMTMLMTLGGRGQDAQQALDAYERLLPGRAIPGDAECRALHEYPGASGTLCTLDAVPHCQRAYLIGQAGVVTYLCLMGCNFPAAYLIAGCGRPRRMTRFRRVTLLVWEGMSAQLRHNGWFNMMQPVSSVGWWKE